MQITIEVTGDQLGPTLKEIVDAMTLEQKQELAGKLAFEYFRNTMTQREKSDGWRDVSKQEQYINDLGMCLKNELAGVVARSPAMTDEFYKIVETMKANLPEFAQKAITSIVAGMIGQQFSAMSHLEFQLNDLRNKLQAIARV